MPVLLGVIILWLFVGYVTARVTYAVFYAEEDKFRENLTLKYEQLAHARTRREYRMTLGGVVLLWPAMWIFAVIIGIVWLLERVLELVGRLVLGGK